MNILYLSYWPADDPLSHGTVIPNIKILASLDNIDKIFFCSVEREGVSVLKFYDEKIVHIPLVSRSLSNVFLTKANDFLSFPAKLRKICVTEKIEMIIARSSLAGALAHLAAKKSAIPYIVESFEPHADYMVESGVWSSYDLRTILQRKFERLQKENAQYLLPVSFHYLDKLLKEGVSELRLKLMPCCVDIESFKFDEEARNMKRGELGFSEENVVGIYVGKFGGIYYEREAFELFSKAKEFFGPPFRLIILSGSDNDWIKKELTKRGFNDSEIFVKKVLHQQVREYLNTADFAFSTIRPAPSRIYCSPIKNGEYWSNGLPIIMEDNIGDDSDIIKKEGCGVIIHSDEIKTFRQLKEILRQGRSALNRQIFPIAVRYRSMKYVFNAYRSIFEG